MDKSLFQLKEHLDFTLSSFEDKGVFISKSSEKINEIDHYFQSHILINQLSNLPPSSFFFFHRCLTAHKLSVLSQIFPLLQPEGLIISYDQWEYTRDSHRLITQNKLYLVYTCMKIEM